jgi:hypothetical protein
MAAAEAELAETPGLYHYIQEQVVLVVEEVEKDLECKTRVVLEILHQQHQHREILDLPK